VVRRSTRPCGTRASCAPCHHPSVIADEGSAYIEESWREAEYDLGIPVADVVRNLRTPQSTDDEEDCDDGPWQGDGSVGRTTDDGCLGSSENDDYPNPASNPEAALAFEEYRPRQANCHSQAQDPAAAASLAEMLQAHARAVHNAAQGESRGRGRRPRASSSATRKIIDVLQQHSVRCQQRMDTAVPRRALAEGCLCCRVPSVQSWWC